MVNKMEQLNDDCIIRILSYLPLYDKIKSTQVCKRWYNINKYILTYFCFDENKYKQNKSYRNWVDKYGKYINKIETNYSNNCPILLDIFKNNMYKIVSNINLNFNIFKNIKILKIQNNSELSDLTNISTLVKLETLIINNCNLKNINGIEKLMKLKEMILDNNYITCIPSTINILHNNLHTLSILNNLIEKLPQEFYDLTKLTTLSMNNVTNINSNHIKKFTNLKVLNMQNCSFSNTANIYDNMYNLQTLDLSYSDISEFPKSILKLNNLQILNLSYTDISTIPNNIKRLKNLTHLNMSSCNLTTVCKNIIKLPKLKILNLSDNYINHIPSVIYRMKVKILILSKNIIEKISEKIYLLENLEYLNLSNNIINYLPRNIKNMAKLKELDLSFNELKYLPISLSRMKKLKYCNLCGNDDLLLDDNIFDANIFEIEYDNLID